MTNRVRVWVILSVLSLSACARESAAKPELPQSISPGWRLVSVTRAGEEWRASYTGPGTANVRIQSIMGQAAGLERIQNFRARANCIAFYSDRYFTIVDWDARASAQAGALVHKLEGVLK